MQTSGVESLLDRQNSTCKRLDGRMSDRCSQNTKAIGTKGTWVRERGAQTGRTCGARRPAREFP